MLTTYDSAATLAAARDHYFVVNGFGADGGYNDAWVDFQLGPIPLPFPNTKGRVRAVGYHDLHHVLTGYDTNTLGEFEISAWEIGAGCGSFTTAWLINLAGFLAGLVAAPRRISAAFFRGRRSRSLYDRDLDAVLAMTVAEGRSLLGLDEARPVTWRDRLALVRTVLVATVIGALEIALVLPLVPVGLVTHWLRRRAATRAGAVAAS